MFTGLIETTAILVERKITGKAGKLIIKPATRLSELRHGESIAINGACLTLEQAHRNGNLEFHLLAESFKRTNLGTLPIGAAVNLERALKIDSRLDGHLVTGHVDTVGTIQSLDRRQDDYICRVTFSPELLPFMIPKGSIAIDGISLTLVEVGTDFFTVHLIPVTLENTALRFRQSGDPVNLETDLLGKYVYRHLELMGIGRNIDPVTMDTLRNAGWL